MSTQHAANRPVDDVVAACRAGSTVRSRIAATSSRSCPPPGWSTRSSTVLCSAHRAGRTRMRRCRPVGSGGGGYPARPWPYPGRASASWRSTHRRSRRRRRRTRSCAGRCRSEHDRAGRPVDRAGGLRAGRAALGATAARRDRGRTVAGRVARSRGSDVAACAGGAWRGGSRCRGDVRRCRGRRGRRSPPRGRRGALEVRPNRPNCGRGVERADDDER